MRGERLAVTPGLSDRARTGGCRSRAAQSHFASEHVEQFPAASHLMQVVPSVTLMVFPSLVTVDFDASPPFDLK